MTSDPDRDLRSAALTVIDELIERYAVLERRMDALEAAQQAERDVVAFAERRPSWSVKQLAEDLGCSGQNIRNYLALPVGHPQRLESFQPSKGAPHRILPEHVAKWIELNGQAP